MENETSRWGVMYQTAWGSWWYHCRRAAFFRLLANIGHVAGALQLLGGGLAYSMNHDAVGAWLNLLGFVSVIAVHYLRIDLKETTHLSLAADFGAISDQAQHSAHDWDLTEKLTAEVARLQREETKHGAQLQVLYHLATNAWMKHIAVDSPKHFTKVTWLQRWLSGWYDLNPDSLQQGQQ